MIDKLSRMHYVRDVWTDSIVKLGGTPRAELFDALRLMYGNRPYHNLEDHVYGCLRDATAVTLDNAACVYLALIYHDAIQFSGVGGVDERLCVSLTEAHCHEMGISGPIIDEISRNILATAHRRYSYGRDAQIVADIDLLVLARRYVHRDGSLIGCYDDYVKAIRKEYDGVDDDAFSSGRKQFLKRTLVKQRLFQTDVFDYSVIASAEDPHGLVTSLEFKNGARKIAFTKKMSVESDARENMFRELSRYGARVAVGGTFDLLHLGHRALLTEAFERAGPKGVVFVGLTDDEQAKKTHEVQSYLERKQNIIDWHKTSQFAGTSIVIEPLRDPFGPTLTDDFDVLVASEETRAGAELVNKRRIESGLVSIPLRIIRVVMQDGERISSTAIRSGKIR